MLVRRLGQLTVMAYWKLLRVVIAERLWVIPAPVPAVTAATDLNRPEKEITP